MPTDEELIELYHEHLNEKFGHRYFTPLAEILEYARELHTAVEAKRAENESKKAPVQEVVTPKEEEVTE